MDTVDSPDEESFLGITAKKLSAKVPTNQTTGNNKNSAIVREGSRNDIILRPDLSKPKPAMKLAHYTKPNYITTENGLYAQNLKAQKDLTANRAQRAYSDSESDAAPQLAVDVHKIFDFAPKTPQEADIQTRINSVPSLKQLNELRKYKLGVHPEKKFRMMLSTSQSNMDATTQFVKDYIIEADKEKRSIPYTNGMNVNPHKSSFQTRIPSPLSTTRASSAEGIRDKSRPTTNQRESVVVKSTGKYDNGIRLAPMTVEIVSKVKAPGDSSASLSSAGSAGRATSPIYTPATFRVPKSATDDADQHTAELQASRDTGGSHLMLLSTDDVGAALSGTSQMSPVGKLINENPYETANRLLAMQDSDSFQDSRREQFLQDSLAEENSVRSDSRSLIEQIRIGDTPGRSRTPKKYNRYVEELDAEPLAIRTKSRDQRLRSSPQTRLHDPADGEYEAERRTGTGHGNRLQCSECYVQGVLWCTSCAKAYCLACWNTIPHHTLYNMVPAFPNKLSKRYQRKYEQVLKDTTLDYLAPAPAITTGKREFERPIPKLVGIPPMMALPGPKPRKDAHWPGSHQEPEHRDEALARMQWSPPRSPTTPDEGHDKSFSPKVMFATKKATRTIVAAQEIDKQLHRAADSGEVYDGNALPAKMPMVTQPTVVYQDYTIPGVVMTGKGEILEITDEFSDSAASSPIYRLGGTSRPGTGRRRTPQGPRRALSPEAAATAVDAKNKPNEPFEGEVRSAVAYVLPSKMQKMAALGMPRDKGGDATPLVPSGFDNSSPHRQLVKKITREGAKSLQKRGDTRTFSPSFSLGAAGAAAKTGTNTSSSNIAATISRPSTVAAPLPCVVKEIVFPSSGKPTGESAEEKDGPRVEDGGHWKEGEFNLQSTSGKGKKKALGPPNITIYEGVPVFTREKSMAGGALVPNPLMKFPSTSNLQIKLPQTMPVPVASASQPVL